MKTLCKEEHRLNRNSVFKSFIFLSVFFAALCLFDRNDISFAAQQTSSGTYYIVSKLDSDYCLAVSEGSCNNFDKIIIDKKENSSRMKFRVIGYDDGSYRIENLYSGKSIEPYKGNTACYTDIVQYASNGDCSEQRWELINRGSGYYLLRNKKADDMYLDIVNAAAFSGNTVQLFVLNDAYYAQQFSFEPVAGEESTLVASANDKMAHNIYLDPNLSETTGCFDGYSIDFYSADSPTNTYWSLCNWSMNNSAFLKKNNAKQADGEYSSSMGGYGGLQNCPDGRVSIIALWEMFYYDRNFSLKKLTAREIYPGMNGTFGGEGNGVHYIGSYDWKSQRWYRMVFRSWTDAKTGTTYVGEWVQDRTTKRWKLIAYYDTLLPDSYMEGSMSFFQENFSTGYLEKRNFRVKNLYVLQHSNTSWTSINSATMSYDYPEWGYNTAGSHVFGANGEYFFGEAGNQVSNQAEYDAKTDRLLTASINKSGTLNDASAVITSLKAVKSGKSTKVKWSVSDTNTPQLTASIVVISKTGKRIYTKEISRPEQRSLSISKQIAKGSTVYLYITDIYGNRVMKRVKVK